MQSVNDGWDILGLPHRRRRQVPELPARPGLVVEDAASGFCGAVLRVEHDGVLLEDRHGRCRLFALRAAAFLLDGQPVTLVRPPQAPAPAGRVTTTASGSVRVRDHRARTARASRIWVEGVHDAELVERVWGHDLRVDGIVVEPLDGLDGAAGLAERIAEFGPDRGHRLGVLVDHLIAGSKESRMAEAVRHEHVLITGHPYVDVWQAVRPSALGIPAWPTVPRGTPWKDGVCAALGWDTPQDAWRRVLAGVRSYRDLETPLIGAVERLIDFVTEETPVREPGTAGSRRPASRKIDHDWPCNSHE
jgi:Protein of unknown function (DUF3097)